MPLTIDRYQDLLRVPQVRALYVLLGDNGVLPCLTRAKLCERCGFSEKSGTITRVMNGVKEGSSSGAARPGLVELGLVETLEIDVEGLVETAYHLTTLGTRVAGSYTGELPDLRGRGISTNLRYRNEEEEEGDA